MIAAPDPVRQADGWPWPAIGEAVGWRLSQLLLLVLLMLLAGCAGGPQPDEAATANAVPRAEPPSSRGNPASYTVDGHTYRVRGSNAGYHAQGVASWYGPGFQGKLTSSGERYNMYRMTAAHKTLRLPAFVQVTNLTNGRKVIVRVNDRGPFVSDRIIDLSYAAAKKIGMLGSGTAPVDLKVLTPGSRTASSPASSGSNAEAAGKRAVWGQDVFIQIGAFAQQDNVTDVRQRLTRAGIGPVQVTSFEGLNRVRVGPVSSLAEYDRTMQQLDKIGFFNAQMVVE